MVTHQSHLNIHNKHTDDYKTGLNGLIEPYTFVHTANFCPNHEALNHTYTMPLTGALYAHAHILQTGSGSSHQWVAHTRCFT